MAIEEDAQKRLKTLCELLEGESVRAATKALPLGGFVAVTMRISLGGTNGPEPDSVIDRRVSEETASAQLRNVAALVLTDHRLFVMSTSNAGGEPAEVMFTLPVEAIDDVEVGAKRSGITRLITMRIRAKDDTELSFEVPKSSSKDGRRFVAVLQADDV